MKQLLIISGKGGTGKTSITAAFAALSNNTVFADCDVDAADLHLILNPTIIEEKPFLSGVTAEIVQDKCILCGKCEDLCRFDAIYKSDKYYVNDLKCEGCGVCHWNCPAKAIVLNENLAGHSFISETRFGLMSHAKLTPGAENSGKLVALVRNNAIELAKKHNKSFILIDGPPGVGCPVIASMTGVDMVLVVTEPSMSGLSDLERVIELAKKFEIQAYVIINKWDISPDLTKRIENKLKAADITMLGKLPYDKSITKAQLEKKSIIEYKDNNITKNLKEIYNKIIQLIKEKL